MKSPEVAERSLTDRVAALGHVATFVAGIGRHLQSGGQVLDGSALLQPLLPGAETYIAATFVGICVASIPFTSAQVHYSKQYARKVQPSMHGDLLVEGYCPLRD